ncbi:MAG: hypothetical protein WCC41_01515 [Rhodomicrobium sp.]
MGRVKGRRDLEILLGGRLNDIELDVGADIEDHNFQRADLFFDLVEKSYDLVNKQ